MVSVDATRTYRLWRLLEFSVHSLNQAYGAAFVRRIVLRHPRRALLGAWAYGHTLQLGPAGERLLGKYSHDEFIQRAVRNGEHLLVATGFCQKPLGVAGSVPGCPAGRFNHNCLYLARLELNQECAPRVPPPCADCSIRLLGQAALQAGASFAVLTSALDIAHDVLLPALEEQRFRQMLLAICPYSLEPMSLALCICGLEGHVFAYDSGACADYPQWLRADQGDKAERTTLPVPSLSRIVHLLENIARDRACQMPTGRPRRYVQEGNVFRPR
jgi:hypothetical protein